MLFGVSFCGRKTERRKKPGGGARAVVILLAALAAIGLLFLAPQWLLVLLVIALTGAVIALACLPGR